MSDSAKAQVQKAIEENAVVVFSKSYCPYCKAAKALLKDTLKVTPYILELDQLNNGSDLQDALQTISNQRTVPNIFISGKHIGGNSDLQALHKKEELLPLLQAAGAV